MSGRRRAVTITMSVLAVILAVCLVLFGSPGTARPGLLRHATASSAADGVVNEQGFTVKLNDISVTGPAGVAPVGTAVHVAVIDASGKVPTEAQGFISGSQAYSISFEGGLQPLQPVTVTWRLPVDDTDPSGLVFVTEHSDSGDWEGIPVALSDGLAIVSMDHFSWWIFGWAKQYVEKLVDYLGQLLDVSYPKPACVGSTAEWGGLDYSVSANRDQVWPCVVQTSSGIDVTIQSANGLIWRYRPTPGDAVAKEGTAPTKFGPLVTLAAYHSIFGGSGEETVLVPGGSAAVSLNRGVTQSIAQVKSDVGLWLIDALATSVDSVADMLFGGDLVSNIKNDSDTIQCIAGLADDLSDPSAHLGTVVSTTLNCLTIGGKLITGLPAFFISCLTSLAALVVSGIQGIIEEIDSAVNGPVTLTITSQPGANSANTESSSFGKQLTSGQLGSSTWAVCSDGTNTTLVIDAGTISDVNFYKSSSDSAVNAPWYDYRNQISTIYITGPVILIGNTVSLFGNLTNLTSIEGLTNFDTSQVTSFRRMFDVDKNLRSLDLSSFDTSGVRNNFNDDASAYGATYGMSYMLSILPSGATIYVGPKTKLANPSILDPHGAKNFNFVSK